MLFSSAADADGPSIDEASKPVIAYRILTRKQSQRHDSEVAAHLPTVLARMLHAAAT